MNRLASCAAVVVSMSALALSARADQVSDAANWSGFYVGAHVGKLYGETSNFSTPVIPGFALPDGKADNWFGGIQGGYRYQFPNNFVLGLSLRAPIAAEESELTTFGNLNTVEMKGAITGAVSLGYAMGRLLPYVNVGYGVAFVEAREVLAGGVASPWVDNTHSLVTVGAGVSYALTNNWSVGFEYNHIEASRETYDCGPAVCGLVGSFDFSGDSVAATLEYRF